jgi:sugar phosphate isomerase/epimerase
MKDSFSYCTIIYQGHELPLVVEHISAAGYDGIELYPKDWEWGFSNLGKKGMKKLFDDSGLAVSAVFGGVLENSSDALTDAAKAAETLGARYVFAVSPIKGAVSRSECEDIVSRACDTLASFGLVLVIHNHAGTYMESISVSHDLCNAIHKPNFGLCLDSLHFALFDDDIQDCLEPVIDYVKYVHLKDMTKTRHEIDAAVPKETWRWGALGHLAETYIDLEKGVIDNKAIAAYIKKSGYSGWWIPEIEVARIDRKDHAANNAGLIRSYVKV